MQIQKVDQEKMTDIFLRYQEPIERYITGMVHNRDTAKDLTQEVMIKFMRYNHEDKEINAHIYRIATTLTIDWLRTQKRKKEVYVGSLSDEMIWSDQKDKDKMDRIVKNPSRNKKIEEDLEEVLMLIDKLPINESMLLKLLIRGLSYREIAQETNKPIGTVKFQIWSARQKLKNLKVA